MLTNSPQPQKASCIASNTLLAIFCLGQHKRLILKKALKYNQSTNGFKKLSLVNIHQLSVVVPFTHPIIIFDVEVCSMIIKGLHYPEMALHRCHMQGSSLMDRKQMSKNWTMPVSQENWHPRKSGTPMQFFLGNLAPLQENWNPHQTVGY